MPQPSKAPFFVATISAAFLLFWLEPMVAKLLLPGLGGAPAVWAVCLVFFQAALLLGYAYAHVSRMRLAPRVQARVQLALLLASCATLPLHLDVTMAPPLDAEPTSWLLLRLILHVAPTFIVAAATAPLVQGWFATSGRDPYFLYAASNLGSFAALLAFPFLLEPAFGLEPQKRAWAFGFAVLIGSTALCARGLSSEAPLALVPQPAQPTGERRSWLWLSLVPSALLVATTHHLSTDIAAIPLLWVLPLALYLLSFVNAFAARPWISVRVAGIAAALALGLAATLRGLGFGLSHASLPVQVGVQCLAVFAACLALHGRVAERRPSAERLSQFYLWLALGGALGGVFAALLAPMLFANGFEHKLALLAVALLLPGAWPARSAKTARPKRGHAKHKPVVAARRWSFAELMDIAAPLLAALVTALSLKSAWAMASLAWLAFALIASGATRPLRVAATLAVLFIAPELSSGDEHVVFRARNFFGTIVVQDQGPLRLLRHGTTQHGAQLTTMRGNFKPLAYYHPSGPIGQLLLARRNSALTRDVAVVGLGVGSLASYSVSGEHWTFYEIDPAIIHVATDPQLFTLLQHAPAQPRIVQGDARLSLVREPDARLSLLVLDAFTSDAVPVHLLTREAFELYRKKLAPTGVIVVHVSNRYLDLASLVAATARQLGMTARVALDTDEHSAYDDDWKLASQWVFVAADAHAVAWLDGLPLWHDPPQLQTRPWTDQHSDLFGVLRR